MRRRLMQWSTVTVLLCVVIFTGVPMSVAPPAATAATAAKFTVTPDCSAQKSIDLGNLTTGDTIEVQSGGTCGKASTSGIWVDPLLTQSHNVTSGVGLPSATFTFTLTSVGTSQTYELPFEDANNANLTYKVRFTYVHPPLAPTAVNVVTGDAALTVSFVAGSDGGSAITDYEYSLDSGRSWTSAGVTASPFTITGLTNGTSYVVEVRAVNAIGKGTSSAGVSGIPQRPAPPGTPGQPTAVAGDASATITVVAPSSGGVPTSYTVTATPGGATCTVTGASGFCVVSGLTNGTAYSFTSTATNVGGTSSPSAASAPVTPSAPAGSESGESSGGSSSSSPTVPSTTTASPPVENDGTSSGSGDASGAPNSNSVPGLFAGNRPLVANGTRPSSPMLLPNGDLPDLPLGEVKALEDEKVVDVKVVSTEAGGLRMTSDNFTLGMEPKAGTGRKDDDSGHLTLTQAGELEVRGSGFTPGSLVDVWLFSTPKFIGTVKVGADGTFSGELSVPGSLAVGDHTLQANGVTATGKSRSLNLGVEVESKRSTLPATGSSSSLPTIGLLIVLLGGALVLGRRLRYA